MAASSEPATCSRTPGERSNCIDFWPWRIAPVTAALSEPRSENIQRGGWPHICSPVNFGLRLALQPEGAPDEGGPGVVLTRGNVGHVALFLLICVNWYPAIGLASLGPLVTVAGFVATFVFVRWDGLRLADVGVALGRGSVRRATAGFGIGFLLVSIHTAITASVAPVRWVPAEDPSISRTLMWFLIFVFFATREEWVYRGYPLRVLAARWGPWPAQITLAIVFAMEHALGGASRQNAILGAGAGALLFGTAALASGGLALPIGMHVAWNLGDWLRGGRGGGGIPGPA